MLWEPGMMKRSRSWIAALAVILCIGASSSAPVMRTAEPLPERLSNQEFWHIIETFSEPEGYFRSDNLLSNELGMQYVIPELIERTRPGGAYMGVGPEQNFTYMAALKPRIAFITDIRRGNLHTQLMYKALFELSADRAEFVSRLFTRKRPEGLEAASTAQDIFRAFTAVPAGTDTAFRENLKAIKDLLVEKHKLPVGDEDLAGIERVYRSFFTFGPGINYGSTGLSFRGRGRSYSSYADLMVLTDGNGISRSFLASNDRFAVVKDLQEKNLVVPLVGDFAGSKAIRSAGKYLKEHAATITAFYLSNVEQYLGDGWSSFCANVASLPLDEKSTFIRASRGFGGPGGGLVSSLGGMLAETKGCAGIR